MDEMVYEQSQYLIAQVAYLYYIKEESQKDIADKLNISASTVSRLLKTARENKIVKNIMDQKHMRYVELSDNIKKRYKLNDVIIAPVTGITDPEEKKKLTALEGARYIQRIIKKTDILGIAWGGTMYHVIHYLNPSQRTNNHFVTLHGSIYIFDYELDAQSLVKRIAKAFSGKYFGITARGLQGSKKAVDLLIEKDKNINKIFHIFDKLTISLSGIGSFYPSITSPLGELTYMNEEELKNLQRAGTYGDIILRFFDKNGNECDTELRERTLGIDFEKYKKIPNKIVAASGTFKLETIKAALKGNLIDTLIIDSELAEELNIN